MNIVNLTPHEIVILNEERKIVKFIPTSGKVARLDSDKVLSGEFDGVPLYRTKYGIPYLAKYENGKEVDRLQFPRMEEGTIYVVSGIFRAGYDRPDFWQPGELVRNEFGQPIGCIGLSQ